MLCPSRAVPVFPLPECVVLPGVLQALHIFEPRYRQMVADELTKPAQDRWVAMALLKPGYEQDYHTHFAPSHATLCLCRVVKQHALPDGRSNILVRGMLRMVIGKELYDAEYRRALLKPMPTISDLSPDEERDLRTLLAGRLARLPADLLELTCVVISRETDLERAVDLIASRLLGPKAAPAKQMILAEQRLDFRLKMLVTLIERLHLKGSVERPAGVRSACPDQN